jgi:hypothetical protein
MLGNKKNRWREGVGCWVCHTTSLTVLAVETVQSFCITHVYPAGRYNDLHNEHVFMKILVLCPLKIKRKLSSFVI